MSKDLASTDALGSVGGMGNSRAFGTSKSALA